MLLIPDAPKPSLRRIVARPSGRRAWVVVMLLAYLATGAVVPAGHMAAPLASGTAFHLCPGDLRSAWILGKLAGVGAAAGDQSPHHHGHHGHHGQGNHNADAGADAAVSVDKSSADTGCIFAGGGVAAPTDATNTTALAGVAIRIAPPARHTVGRAANWLRPPPRSPPA